MNHNQVKYKDMAHKTKAEFESKPKPTRRYNNKVKCPSCGSAQISAGNKGFGLGKAVAGGVLLGPVGLLSGFIGSGQVTLACLRCGNRWKAGM